MESDGKLKEKTSAMEKTPAEQNMIREYAKTARSFV